METPNFPLPNPNGSGQFRSKLATLLPPSPGQTRQQSYSAHPDSAPPLLPCPRLLTDNLPLDTRNRPKSASTRLSPPAAIWAQNRRRFYSVPHTVTPFVPPVNPPSGAQSTNPANQMDWSWQQSQPVAFAQHSVPYPNGDEKRDYEPGPIGYLGLNTQQSYAPQSYYSGMPFRPALALDTTSPSNFPSQLSSSQSPAPPSVVETASDGERITTPGMQYTFPGYTNNYAYSLDPTNDPSDGSQWSSQFASQYYSDFTPSHNSSSYDISSQGTISPSQLGHSQLNFENLRNKSFSDLMQSRGSSSSASSNEGESNGLDDWQKLHRMLPVNSDRILSPEIGTVPEPARRNDAQWSTSKSSRPMFEVPGTPASVPNPEALDNALRSYISAPNRLAFGERKIIVMSPKVGQKSYGTEKRFLCPHPQAVLLGSSWWHKSHDGCPTATRLPPRVNISLEGENPVKDAICSWTTTDGQNLDEKINTQTLNASETPFIGNVAGKNLHISDTDSKRREVRALVTVKAPLAHHAGVHGWGPAKGTMSNISNDEVVGVFPSKEIKIISKPSKKKANAKSSELLVQHGTTVAIFNRVKSQTTSTRYLSVTPDPTRILGSDGKPVTGAVPPPGPTHRTAFPGFTASASIWESFIIWLADPKSPSGPGAHPPLHPGWPAAPANAMFSPHFSPPVRYNNTIILQSLQTGLCSPVLIIRRVEQDAEVVGGDGSSNDILNCLPDGEMGGDLVSQLQKVAFEVYNPDQQYMAPHDSKWGGVWLSCDQEVVQDKVVNGEKRWAPVPVPTTGRSSRPNSVPSTPSARYGVLPMTPHSQLPHLPGTPSLPGSPNSVASSQDYFGVHSSKASSTSLVSHGDGLHDLSPSSETGPIRRQRTGSASSRGPLSRPPNRKRASGEVPTVSSYEYLSSNHTSPTDSNRMCWTMNVGDVCIWTIVSTEQNTYTFYVPEYVKQTSEPYAPMPNITRLLPPDAAGDAGPHAGHTFTARTTKPLITLYGKGFQKKTNMTPRHLIYYDAEPADYNEARCDEVMAATEPSAPLGRPANIFLVRDDGECILPTHLTYP